MKKLKMVLLGSVLLGSSVTVLASEFPTIMLYKSATCSCCVKWADHMEENGFTVMNHDVQDVSLYKKQAGVPDRLYSCHTAMIGDYAVEGHVPAEDVIRLLKERPEGIDGIAVGGMPLGSPGMEYGDRKDSYNVIAFNKNGKTSVYASH